MRLNDYQRSALTTYVESSDDPTLNLARLALGISDEGGEVCGKVKKWLRGDDIPQDEMYSALAKEIGDVMWYCAALANHIGYDLEEVARMNVGKLSSRKERGTIRGSGDER